MVFQDKVIKKFIIGPGGELTIGRHSANKIVVDNLSVSSRHARITQEKDGLFVQDLGSTNGTFVNKEKVSKCRLVHQDWIGIGNHTLIIDMYETLSLESTMEMLMAGSFGGGREADQTVMFDMSSGHTPARLIFLAGGQGEMELLANRVTIGRNKDADIVIVGLWSFFAGQPAAYIERRGNNYIFNYTGGKLKPRINGTAVSNPVFLNHQDEIKIGPLKMRVELS
ncbi:MAG: FHA domain-containing protein [Desulfosarcinaceae bacterium]